MEPGKVLMQKVREAAVKDNQALITWLGQAGFIVKTGNLVITIDPYLSNCVEREIGFKRLMPAVMNKEELKSDVLITTHEHLDHFDMDAIPMLIKNTKEKVLCSATSASLCSEIGIDDNIIVSLSEGDSISVDGTDIKAVYADHGELAPDSIGILIDTGNIKVYYSSDTAYRPEEISKSLNCEPDIGILPINGMYGNLDSVEAAKLARHLKIATVIPCHFWMFREHNGKNGDPLTFETSMKRYHKKGNSLFLTPGETFIYNKEV